jgi:hypothetical protein
MPLGFLLRYRNYYVSISRAVIPPRQGGRMARAGCASTTCAPAPRSFAETASQWPDHRSASRAYHSSPVTQHRGFLIGSTAIKNARNYPKNNIMTFSNWSRIACLRAHFALPASLPTNHFSAPAEFLIATGPELKFDVTHSQETRKLFLIATFSPVFSGFARTAGPRSTGLTRDDRSETRAELHCVLTPLGWYHGALEAMGM